MGGSDHPKPRLLRAVESADDSQPRVQGTTPSLFRNCPLPHTCIRLAHGSLTYSACSVPLFFCVVQGEWVHPLIANPDYDASAAASLYHRCVDCAYVGFELWQVWCEFEHAFT